MPAVNPDGTPGNVAADELIESAWGNAVATKVGEHEAELNLLNPAVAALQTEKRQFAQVSITSNANGDFTITFGTPFTVGPIVVANVVDANVGAWVNVTGTNPTVFTGRLYTVGGTSDAIPAPNITCTISYVALGI